MHRVEIDCKNCHFRNKHACNITRSQANNIQNSLMIENETTCTICYSKNIGIYVRGEAEPNERLPIEDSLKW